MTPAQLQHTQCLGAPDPRVTHEGEWLTILSFFFVQFKAADTDEKLVVMITADIHELFKFNPPKNKLHFCCQVISVLYFEKPERLWVQPACECSQ